MIRPYQAVYGAKNSAHELLFWDHPSEQPPNALLGLTDKPPGYLSPQDIWWPAFGCGPIGDWWAMWWVTPDNESKRRGMVRSKVMLWKLSELYKVDDLLPFIEELSDNNFNAEQTECQLLLAASNALISSSEHQLVVLQESNLGYPLLVGLLWKQLWPEAKCSFSARYMVTPPQRTTNQRSCSLYCVPLSHINQWKTENVRVIANEIDTADRGALYLANGSDDTIKRIFSESPPKSAQLSIMSMIARCADRLDKFEQQPTVENSLNLLRTLVAIYPEENEAINLKRSALVFISKNIDVHHKNSILGLANLNSGAFAPDMLPKSSFSKACGKLFTTLPPEDMQSFFERISDTKVQSWWRKCVQQELKKIIQIATPSTYRRLLSWLGQNNASAALRGLITIDESTENSVVDSASSGQLTSKNIVNIQSFAVEAQWSKLFTWCLLNNRLPEEPFFTLNKFFGKQSRGHSYLVQNLPIEMIVNDVFNDSPNITYEEAASRTKHSPRIFLNLDITTPETMKLWLAHVMAGGDPWPCGINQEAYASAYIEELLSGNGADTLQYIAKEIALTVLNHPERSSIWSYIPKKEGALLASEVAEAYMLNEALLEVDNQPESILADQIIEKLNKKSSIEASLLLHCLSWQRSFPQSTVINWLDKLPTSQWSIISKPLGLLILRHRWVRVAEHIYTKCFPTYVSRGEQKYLPTLHECSELLNYLKKFKVQRALGRSPHIERSKLSTEIARIGSEIACEELDGIWVRAGGKRSELKRSDYQRDNWFDAATKAEQGKLESGLLGLVNELLVSFPNNQELQEIKSILIP
ncbi:hypothetical protein [Shewanella algae]|uniref:GAP1-N1 domain-containing protein n=1 Tax=Shewanella algae TaxID=38313 RepID=UPI001143A4D2|nr:hypothetical protein [Shewanella algae]